MIKFKDIFNENINKLNLLPSGKIFQDAKNIESVFKRSSHSWSESIEMFEKNRNNSIKQNVNVKDIKITQPNIQVEKIIAMIPKFKTLPIVDAVKFKDGEIVIFDGHHRLITHWILDKPYIKVNLVIE